MKYWMCYEMKMGKFRLTEEDGKLIEVSYIQENMNGEDSKKVDSECVNEETALLIKTKKELEEYFQGTRKEFDIPLAPEGTEFQKKVWKALHDIPYGATCSYKDIAIRIGDEKSCRAVGMANNRNPIMIIVPCHRVIGKNGKMVGYGAGITMKESLLALEKMHNKSSN